MNFWDYSIIAAVAILVGLGLWRMGKKKKTGCPGCCSCCSGSCPASNNPQAGGGSARDKAGAGK